MAMGDWLLLHALVDVALPLVTRRGFNGLNEKSGKNDSGDRENGGR